MSFWPFPKTLLDELSRGLACGPGIELGSGSGDLSGRFRSVGIDLLTSDLGSPCDVRADALDLPFRSGHFGLVVAGNLLRHIPPTRRSRLFDEAARVLSPGGRMVLLEDHPEARTPAESNYRDALSLLARVDASRGAAIDLDDVLRERPNAPVEVVWSACLENEERPRDPLAPADWIEARAGLLDGAVAAHRQEVLAHGMEYGRFQALVLQRVDRVVET
jgi:SAM-dependent methyltransferase